MNKLLVVILLVSVAAGISWADNEFWSSGAFQSPYNEKIKLQLIPEIRVRNNLSDLYYLLIYIGPSITLNKNFGINLYLAPNYVKTNSSWTNLGYADITYKTDLPWFAAVFNNRERLEYDFTPQVLKIRSLFRFSKDGWFADDELFYNTNKGFFDEGRSQFGYSIKLNGDNNLSVSYLLRRQKTNSGDDWTRTSAINAGFKVNF